MESLLSEEPKSTCSSCNDVQNGENRRKEKSWAHKQNNANVIKEKMRKERTISCSDFQLDDIEDLQFLYDNDNIGDKENRIGKRGRAREGVINVHFNNHERDLSASESHFIENYPKNGKSNSKILLASYCIAKIMFSIYPWLISMRISRISGIKQ